MSALLEGRVTIVTGAGSGIGRATAVRFAAEGAAVVVNDIDPVSAEATTQTIRDQGGDSIAVPGNVGRAQEVQRLIERAVATFREIAS